MGSIVEVYDSKVSMRTRLYILKSIAGMLALKPKRYEIFRSTVFGQWLDLKIEDHDNHMIHYLLQHQRYVKDPSVHMPFIFYIGPHTIQFGRREFYLIIGFIFGDSSLDHLNGGESAFRDRVFPNISNVKGDMLYKILNNQSNFDKLLDDDVVRLCLLLALDFVFMGYEMRHVIANELLNLVDDLATWNDFSWGPPYPMPTYPCSGFVWPLGASRYGLVLSEQDLRTYFTYQTWDFQSRIAAIEKAVNQHKTSKIESDNDGSNVFSTTMEFDPDYFSCLIENPHNRVALTKKITDMEVQFRVAHLEKVPFLLDKDPLMFI
ncbi:phospholipase-like protein [Tanacetum coccineum]